MQSNSFITKFEKDENGDVFIDFPEELLEAVGWEDGDEIKIDILFGRIILGKVEDGAGAGS